MHLVEKAERLNPGESVLPKGEDIDDFIRETTKRLQSDKRIETHLNSEVLDSSGYLGNFLTRIKTPKGEIHLSHGAAVVSCTSPAHPEKDGFFVACPDPAPGPIRETIVRARAAAVRVSAILARDRIPVVGVAPVVSSEKCAACLTCVRTCPCGVPYIGEKGFAQIEPAICRGCGMCASECPGKAISLQQFTDEQMQAELEMFRCSLCGQPYLTRGRLEYLKRKLSAGDLQPLDRHLCSACSRKKGAEDQVWIA